MLDMQLLRKDKLYKHIVKKLEKSGTKTDNFMLELDSEGFKTGYFISKSHWGHFEKAKTEALLE